MNSKQKLSDIVFNKKLFIIYLCTYFVPFLCSWVAFVYLKEFKLSDTFIGLISPVGIGGIIGIISFVLIWWYSQKKRFDNFDPENPASVKKINNIEKRLQDFSFCTSIGNW